MSPILYFLRDVYIRTQRDALSARRDINLATHPIAVMAMQNFLYFHEYFRRNVLCLLWLTFTFRENQQNRFGSNYSLHCSPPDGEPAAGRLSCTRPQDSPTTFKQYLTLHSQHEPKNDKTKPQMLSLTAFNRYAAVTQ